MRLTFKPYIILLMFAIIPLQSGAWDIKGQWIRKLVLVDDNMGFSGNIIEILQSNGHYHGKLVHLSTGTAAYGYSFGDVKWKGIKRIGKRTFVFDGLLLRSDMTRTFNGPIYVQCQLIIMDENHIKIVALSEELDFLGQQQVWERIQPS